MKKIIIGFVFLGFLFACDSMVSQDQPDLLALTYLPLTNINNELPYTMHGGYLVPGCGDVCLATVQIYNNRLPREYMGKKIRYFILHFDNAVLNATNTKINYIPINPIIDLFDYKNVYFELREVNSSFKISGDINFYNGETISIKTPLIIY